MLVTLRRPARPRERGRGWRRPRGSARRGAGSTAVRSEHEPRRIVVGGGGHRDAGECVVPRDVPGHGEDQHADHVDRGGDGEEREGRGPCVLQRGGGDEQCPTAEERDPDEQRVHDLVVEVLEGADEVAVVELVEPGHDRDLVAEHHARGQSDGDGGEHERRRRSRSSCRLHRRVEGPHAGRRGSHRERR